MRGFTLVLVLLCGVLVGATGFAEKSVASKRPLDLPVGAGSGDEEDEDTPEVISFYGGEFEGDAFFWLLDRSLSMQGEPFTLLKEEVTGALDQLSKRSEFAIIAFAEDFTEFSNDGRPYKASLGNRTQGKQWVDALGLAIWTCMADPAGRIIEIANRSRKPVEKRLIIMVGDGVPLCGGMSNNTSDEVLSTIASANINQIAINTIFISNNDNEGQDFFRQIAEENGGQFMVVD